MRKLLPLLILLASCGGGGGGGTDTSAVQEPAVEEQTLQEAEQTVPAQEQTAPEETSADSTAPEETAVSGQLLASRVAGATVCWQEKCTQTDEEGRFTLTVQGLPAVLTVRVGELTVGQAEVDSPQAVLTPLSLAGGDRDKASEIGAFLHLLAGDQEGAEVIYPADGMVETEGFSLTDLTPQEQAEVKIVTPQGEEKTVLLAGGKTAVREGWKLKFYLYDPESLTFQQGRELDAQQALLAVNALLQLWEEGLRSVKAKLEYPQYQVFYCDNYAGDLYDGTTYVDAVGENQYKVRYYNCDAGEYKGMTGTLLVTATSNTFSNSTVTAPYDLTFKLPDGREVKVKAGAEVKVSTDYSVYDPNYVAHASPTVTDSSVSGTVELDGSQYAVETEVEGKMIYHYSFQNERVSGTVNGLPLSAELSYAGYYDSDESLTDFHDFEVRGKVSVDGMTLTSGEE